MYDRKTLVEALTVIVEVCKEFKNCGECPMYSDYEKECLSGRYPEEWEIVTDTTSWRAIKN